MYRDVRNQSIGFSRLVILRPRESAYWGEGLAYEASRRIVAYGFSTLRMQRIFAETISENGRARALAERLGMRLEGELVRNRFFRARWWNTVIYALLADEWSGAG